MRDDCLPAGVFPVRQPHTNCWTDLLYLLPKTILLQQHTLLRSAVRREYMLERAIFHPPFRRRTSDPARTPLFVRSNPIPCQSRSFRCCYCCLLCSFGGDGGAVCRVRVGSVRSARQSPLDEKGMLVWVPPVPDKRPRLPGHPAEGGGLRGRLAHDRARRAREGIKHTYILPDKTRSSGVFIFVVVV